MFKVYEKIYKNLYKIYDTMSRNQEKLKKTRRFVSARKTGYQTPPTLNFYIIPVFPEFLRS